ncbi:ATP-binding protein [Desulfobacterales bacterium HSG17]|nr:ATP-binding protein [Desulfobacterales bacterium HSG17]
MTDTNHSEIVKILIVDDQEKNLFALEKVLDDPGYELVKATSGSEALRLILKHDFALLLLDVRMPDIDGFDTAGLIRQRDKNRNIPIIFITAEYKNLENISRGYELNAVDYILKPFDPVILKTKVGILAELHRKNQLIRESEKRLEKEVSNRTSELRAANEKLRHEIQERKLIEKNLEKIVEERTGSLKKSLSDSEEIRHRIDAILKSMSDGLIVTDNKTRIILMNNTAEDILGVTFNRVMGKPVRYALIDEDLKHKVQKMISENKIEEQFDIELPDYNLKRSKIIRASTAPIKEHFDTQTGYVTILHDVTKERDIERMKTEFISTAAHELRTPLTSIQGFSEILLMRDNLPEDQKKKYLGFINNQAVHLAEIINDLLDISRIESGKSFVLEKKPCKAGDIIRQLMPQFENQYINHKFEVALIEEPDNLDVDKDKMIQVLKNLISNAVKYSPEGGIILICSKIDGKMYEVSIEDEGIGMTQEQVEKVFDKFYRVDASNTAIEGTGLGMSIVKHIVEAHKGRVWVESEYGRGTKVIFSLPM